METKLWYSNIGAENLTTWQRTSENMSTMETGERKNQLVHNPARMVGFYSAKFSSLLYTITDYHFLVIFMKHLIRSNKGNDATVRCIYSNSLNIIGTFKNLKTFDVLPLMTHYTLSFSWSIINNYSYSEVMRATGIIVFVKSS